MRNSILLYEFASLPSGWLFYVCSVKAAMSLGRRAIGVELETERFEQTVREVQDLVSQNG
ncbi:site-specific DNA-methyltransferase [Escherichia coli]|uniref:site-specific DNA-methyltransferase n=1 Tax=Escherichia coli TaxID=562 RepID=UPI0020247CA5|nr:site-specific DNA-methyltransferase [Escherichia coli]MCW7328950.1 site-specific DNA-methyltransferase [Escherichia coli]